MALLLGRFSSGEDDIRQFSKAFATFQDAIDPTTVHATALAEAQTAIDANDYKFVLRLFNKKELSKNLGRFFGITKGNYVDKVREMAKRGLGDVPAHLKTYLPDIDILLCLTVSGLIQNIVRDLGLRTVGDLCSLRICCSLRALILASANLLALSDLAVFSKAFSACSITTATH